MLLQLHHVHPQQHWCPLCTILAQYPCVPSITFSITMNCPLPSSLLVHRSTLIPQPILSHTLPLGTTPMVPFPTAPRDKCPSSYKPEDVSSIPVTGSSTLELTLWTLFTSISSLSFIGYPLLYRPPWPSFATLRFHSVSNPSAPIQTDPITEGPPIQTDSFTEGPSPIAEGLAPIASFTIIRILLTLSIVTYPLFILAAPFYAARECDSNVQLRLHAS